MLRNIWNTIFVNTFNEVESQKTESTGVDKKVFTILLTVVLSLVFIEYFGNFQFLISSLKSIGLSGLSKTLNDIQSYFPNVRLFQLTFLHGILLSI
mgnify:CR=1 FL=1